MSLAFPLAKIARTIRRTPARLPCIGGRYFTHRLQRRCPASAAHSLSRSARVVQSASSTSSMYDSQAFQCFQRFGYITEQLKAQPTMCQKSSALFQRLLLLARAELIKSPSLLFEEFPPVPNPL